VIRDVRIVVRYGYGASGIVRFEGVSDAEPSPDEVAAAQEAANYHPAGYGGPNNIRAQREAVDRWRVTWTCFASCD